MAQTGATAVGTLAGTMAQENAEILAGICIVQLIQPGTPVCYGGIPHAFDMRTTQLIFGGPEQALMAVGMTQMGKFYGLPVYINVGLTDSKLPDAQAGLEAGITLACGAMAGADIFGHLGICGVDQATSLPMLVMQHEIIGYVERLLRGVEVNDEKLGLDVIEQAWRRAVSWPGAHRAAFPPGVVVPAVARPPLLGGVGRRRTKGHGGPLPGDERPHPPRARAHPDGRRHPEGGRQSFATMRDGICRRDGTLPTQIRSQCRRSQETVWT